MLSVYSRVTYVLWLIAIVLTGHLASMVLWPQQMVEARPLGAVRAFDVVLKTPDLIVPNVFAVNVGDTIRFNIRMQGGAPHNLHIGGNGVDVQSPIWQGDGVTGVWEFTFTRAGVYALYCTQGQAAILPLTHRHVGPMEGVIVVTDAGAPAPDLYRYQTRNVRLSADGGSGITGVAHIQPKADGGLSVRVEGYGARPGTAYISGLYDRRSVNCRGGLMGAFASTREARADGTVRIVYQTPGPIESWYQVSIREGTPANQTAQSVRACGEVSNVVIGVDTLADTPGPAPAPAVPAALPRTGDSVPESVLFGMAVLGSLALCLGVLLRRRAKTA